MLPLLICDDSAMARKQLLRALPSGWDVNVTQAENGRHGLDAIRQGLAELVLLDLTMPEMDGYQVLAAIRQEQLDCQVIVISGDVQDEAVRRVLALGALDFLRKPVDPQVLQATLSKHGLLGLPSASEMAAPREAPNVGFRDAFRETVNVAMGRAGALLAKVLGVFVRLPLPNVNILEVGELQMALAEAQRDESVTVVCQGFIGGGIAGEALLIFHDSESLDMARLMDVSAEAEQGMEMYLDLGAVLIGACLSGISDQIELPFSHSHPQILGAHGSIDELIRLNRTRWRKTLAVELSYSLEGHDIHFDLLLLFTEDSVERLRTRLSFMAD